MADLSIILVNWNCIAFTEQCVRSIQATVTGIDYEIIVVDNASGDSPCLGLVERFPWVKLILSQANLGFGGANNLGVNTATGTVFFFLNPDTVLLPSAAVHAYHLLKSRPDAGVIGCRLLNPDRSVQLSSVQAFPTVINQLLALRWLQERWPRTQGKAALYAQGGKGAPEVDAVSGAGLMMRRAAFCQVGGFSGDYFMFAEEIDLCFRVRRAGWKVLHCSSAEVIHFGGQSTKHCEDGYAALAMRESVHLFLHSTQGVMSAGLYRATQAASAVVRIGIASILFPLSSVRRRAGLAQVFSKWRNIGLWALAPSRYRAASPKAAKAAKSALSAG